MSRGLAAWQSWGPRWNHRHGGLSQVAVGRYPKGSVDAGVALAGSDSLVAVGDVDPRSAGAREALEDELWRAAVGIWPYAGLPSRPVRQHQPISAKTTLSGGWTQSFHRLGPDEMRWSLRKVFFVHNIRSCGLFYKIARMSECCARKTPYEATSAAYRHLND